MACCSCPALWLPGNTTEAEDADSAEAMHQASEAAAWFSLTLFSLRHSESGVKIPLIRLAVSSEELHISCVGACPCLSKETMNKIPLMVGRAENEG
jgi:hypothetical protein